MASEENPVSNRLDNIRERIASRFENVSPIPHAELFQEARDHSLSLGRWSLASLIAINGGAILALAQLGRDATIPVQSLGAFAAGVALAMLSAFFARHAASAEASQFLAEMEADRCTHMAASVYNYRDPGASAEMRRVTRAINGRARSFAENPSEAKLDQNFLDDVEAATRMLNEVATMMKEAETWLASAEKAQDRIGTLKRTKARRLFWANTVEYISLASFVVGAVIAGVSITP